MTGGAVARLGTYAIGLVLVFAAALTLGNAIRG